MADGGGRAIDERHFCSNDHRLSSVANGQAKVAHQRAADIDVQRLDALGAETGRFRRNRVGSIGDRRDVVASFSDRRGPRHRNRSTRSRTRITTPGSDGSGRIDHAPLQARGLRDCWHGSAQR